MVRVGVRGGLLHSPPIFLLRLRRIDSDLGGYVVAEDDFALSAVQGDDAPGSGGFVDADSLAREYLLLDEVFKQRLVVLGNGVYYQLGVVGRGYPAKWSSCSACSRCRVWGVRKDRFRGC